MSTSPSFEPIHIHDKNVSPELDLQLRALFLEAFPIEAEYLKTQRYFRECPTQRWIIFEERNQPVAHIAAYEKTVGTVRGKIPVVGVAEVCVTAPFRGRGLVRRMLQDVHAWARERSVPFALLFGSMDYYGSSGYRPTTNVIRYWKYQTCEWVEEPITALMLPLGQEAWPEGLIDLAGPLF